MANVVKSSFYSILDVFSLGLFACGATDDHKVDHNTLPAPSSNAANGEEERFLHDCREILKSNYTNQPDGEDVPDLMSSSSSNSSVSSGSVPPCFETFAKNNDKSSPFANFGSFDDSVELQLKKNQQQMDEKQERHVSFKNKKEIISYSVASKREKEERWYKASDYRDFLLHNWQTIHKASQLQGNNNSRSNNNTMCDYSEFDNDFSNSNRSSSSRRRSKNTKKYNSNSTKHHLFVRHDVNEDLLLLLDKHDEYCLRGLERFILEAGGDKQDGVATTVSTNTAAAEAETFKRQGKVVENLANNQIHYSSYDDCNYDLGHKKRITTSHRNKRSFNAIKNNKTMNKNGSRSTTSTTRSSSSTATTATSSSSNNNNNNGVVTPRKYYVQKILELQMDQRLKLDTDRFASMAMTYSRRDRLLAKRRALQDERVALELHDHHNKKNKNNKTHYYCDFKKKKATKKKR